ncbi:MAG: chromosomal replication initiator protein DnaA [Candidatus Buchananbacteria bacterium]
MNNQQLWQAALGELELSLSKASFTTWFKNTFIISNETGHLTVAVPNAFTKAWFEKKYHPHILKSLKNVSNNEIKSVVYKIELLREAILTPIVKEQALNQVVIKADKPEPINQFGISAKYTFASFIIGKNNELAAAAAQAVTQKPGETYNPLFIYGGVGLGKTHLLHAISNEILKKFPTKKILYVSCEKFTNDFINAISQGRAESFKEKYRNVDVLLIDDIQFLAGKEGTQEEFFHTFNALHQINKQIIISSDRPPKAIQSLEHRLVSRFEWGMIADVNSPNLETRIAILDSKCREKNYLLSSEIINYVANIIQNNIRELEGALNRIIAYHQLNNLEPTLETIKPILSTIASASPKKSLTTKKIISTVAEYFDLKLEDLNSPSRKKHLAGPRQIAMYLMREELKTSYPSIGLEFGGRDHTTAIHAYEKIHLGIDNDAKLAQDVNLIKQRLYNI